MGQLTRQKEKRPDGAQNFSIEVHEVSKQLMEIFCDSGWLELRVLPADRAIRTPGGGSAVATGCAYRLRCLSINQGRAFDAGNASSGAGSRRITDGGASVPPNVPNEAHCSARAAALNKYRSRFGC